MKTIVPEITSAGAAALIVGNSADGTRFLIVENKKNGQAWQMAISRKGLVQTYILDIHIFIYTFIHTSMILLIALISLHGNKKYNWGFEQPSNRMDLWAVLYFYSL